MLKVLFQELRDTLTTAFERHVTVKIFRTWIKIHANFFLRITIMKPKWMKVRVKLSVGKKSEPVLRRKLDQGISLINVFLFFSQTNLAFKFKLSNFLTFHIMRMLEFIQCLYAFFIRTSKILMTLIFF